MGLYRADQAGRAWCRYTGTATVATTMLSCCTMMVVPYTTPQ